MGLLSNKISYVITMAGPPAAIYRKHLYSIIPELESIDLQIGPYSRTLPPLLSSNIQSDFHTQLSNLSSSEDVNDFYLSNITTLYITHLENSIILANCANESDRASLIRQKITLLESAYSNVSSTL
jgi:hypothetical protein